MAVADLRIVKLAPLAIFVGLALSSAAGAGPPSNNDPVAHARDMVKQGDYHGALLLLDPVLKEDRKNISARLTASAACLGLQDSDCSDKHLRAVAAVAPETPGYQLLLGRTLLLRADEAAAAEKDQKQVAYAQEAAKAFTTALAESPNPTTLSFLAMAQRAGKQAAEAKATYMAWVAAAPRDPNAYGATAAFLAETGAWGEAEKLAARAPEGDPRLAHDIRVAVMRNGMTIVPWATIRPFFDAVEAEETDPATRQALLAYRAIRSSKGRAAMLAMLDYLDADPEDHLNVTRKMSEASSNLGEQILEGAKDDKPPDGLLPPQIRKKVDPIVPDTTTGRRFGGRVVLACRIKKDGSIGSLHVISTSNARLSDSALVAVRQWRYSPATVHGEPIEFPYEIRVEFRVG